MKFLIVVNMQNDFITGSLGTKEAEAILPKVLEKIRTYRPEQIFVTQDTHPDNYLDGARFDRCCQHHLADLVHHREDHILGDGLGQTYAGNRQLAALDQH